MNQRILQFLAAENISQAQFADTIEVARATVSHVIAGRNKPGFDFIESISHHYPNLNIEWLITGKGKMYKSSPIESTSIPSVPIQNNTSVDDLFSSENEPIVNDGEAITSEIAAAESALRRAVEKTRPSTSPKTMIPDQTKHSRPEPQPVPSAEIRMSRNGRRITKIIVFYDDNSFQEVI